MPANLAVIGPVTPASSASASTAQKTLYDTEYQELEQLKNTLISIQTAPEDFRKRVALIENGSEAHALLGAGGNLELGPTAIKNVDPRQIDRVTARQHEQFKNLKLAYLEQETKDKFVRALVEDSPLVETEDVTMVEKANAEKKQQLKALKKECAQMEKETAMRAREVVEEHARVQNEANEMMDLITELRAMEREVAALESKRQQKQRELEGDADFNTTSDFDPELRLPYEDMQRLAASYTQQARKLETATLAPLVAEADKNDRVLQDTTRRVAELRQQRARVEVIARESGVARERELARGLGKKEATAQWHRNILTVLERALGVSDFAVEPLAQHQASTQPQIAAAVAHQKLWKLNYVVAGAAVEAVIEEDKNQVVSAKLTDPQNRVTPAVVERLVAESRDVEPSWFLIQLFSLLQ